jgi:hypothetical protein
MLQWKLSCVLTFALPTSNKGLQARSLATYSTKFAQFGHPVSQQQPVSSQAHKVVCGKQT